MSGIVPTILIVDDIEMNLFLLRAMLEKEGFNVLEAMDGASSRQIAAEQTPDLILLDIMMPGEDGFTTCSKLKSDPATSDIPVLFISALDDVDKKVNGFDVGALDYITKPFENAEVLARTKLHLRLGKARKTLIEDQRNRLKQLSKAQQEILISPKELPEANFAVKYIPVLAAGGDFYDVLSFNPDIYGYFCADVSGHDLGSSLATSAFKALIHQNAGLLYSPMETFQIINSVLKTSLGGEIYLTAVYALLNRRKKTLQFVSAGHTPVIYFPSGQHPYPVKSAGDVLGLFDNIVLEKKEIDVNEGDRFFLYTDGIIEETGKRKIPRSLGLQLLLDQIEKTKNLPLDESVNSIISWFFRAGKTAGDDLLLMGVQL